MEVDQFIENKDFKAALDIAGRYPLKKGHVICQTTALDEFIVTKENLLKTNHLLKKNPRYEVAGDMKIFLVAELETLFQRKPFKSRRRIKLESLKKLK